jgi:hypothetical protein
VAGFTSGGGTARGGAGGRGGTNGLRSGCRSIAVSCAGRPGCRTVSGYLEQLQEDRTPLARRIVIALDTNFDQCVGRRINGSPLAAMYLSRRSGWREATFEASMPRTELFDRRRIAIVEAQPSMTLESPCEPDLVIPLVVAPLRHSAIHHIADSKLECMPLSKLSLVGSQI